MSRKLLFRQFFLNFRREIFICLFLTVSTYAVYHQVGRFSFVRFDDNVYVADNNQVHQGLTRPGLRWALTTFHGGNWHPLTWLSHMVDVQLFGMDAGGHHLTSVFFHIANALLLFLVLRRMTGATWRSGFVAALFALHPLHVESVAWVSERKDVLSTFFWLLTLFSYAGYAQKSGRYWYLAAFLFFMLGLMAKPMLVTLPFVLLLLDYWPLQRTQMHGGRQAETRREKFSPGQLVVEKLPFFFLAAASCGVTFLAQKSGGAVRSFTSYPLTARLANALIAYVGYLGKMIWPHHLAPFYPYPASIPIWPAAAAALVLTVIFVFVFMSARRRPYLAVGWLWYVGTLVPVIGLVQVGGQSMADRYSYIPLVGIFVLLTWGVDDLLSKWRHSRVWKAALAVVLLPLLMTATWFQVRTWQNNISFFRHWLAVIPDSRNVRYGNNPVAHYNLGVALAGQNHVAAAIKQYAAALRLKPDYPAAHNNLGNALMSQGKVAQALAHYARALALKPHDPEIHNNLGVALYMNGQTDHAIAHFKTALRLNPHYLQARQNLQKARR